MCFFNRFSCVCPDRDSLIKDALELAGQIAKKSPVAMSGIKHHLNFSRDHSVQQGLEYMVGSVLTCIDTVIAFSMSSCTRHKVSVSQDLKHLWNFEKTKDHHGDIVLIANESSERKLKEMYDEKINVKSTKTNPSFEMHKVQILAIAQSQGDTKTRPRLKYNSVLTPMNSEVKH